MSTANTEPRRGIALLPLSEVALAAVTLATVACMWRLFVDTSYLLPLVAHGIAAHLLVAILRRRGIGVAASALVSLIAALLALVWGHLASTTSYGFPIPATLTAAADHLEVAWRSFGQAQAPAPVLTGYLLWAGAAIWVAAWLADLAAFRSWTPFEALIPSGTLFLFTSFFSAERGRAAAAALWLTTALVFVLLHRTARQQTSPSWLGSDARIGARALMKAGAGLTALAIGLAWVVGPRLPGAGADALVPFDNDGHDGPRTTVSPLVEIRGQLVELSQVELFTVVTSEPSYWRLTSLDTFDGETWSSRGSYDSAGDELPGSGTRDVPTEPVTSTFEILDLSTIWLPAAFEAGGLQMDQGEARWDEDSSTLIVSPDVDSSNGLRYEVTSDLPAFDPATLSEGSDEIPDEIAEGALELPSDFPQSVIAESQRIVAGASSPYEQALALQNSFRDGSFTYSLAAPPGQSDSAIEDFLFNTRVGYCQQFAGTFAAMARSVGLPARVAVGFTPGTPDPLEPSRLIVRGENAHAWPEVYIAGAGWVAFEPTPGRGAPGAETYTGVPEQQDVAGPSTQPTPVGGGSGPPVDPNQPPEGTGSGNGGPGLGDAGANAEVPLIDVGDSPGGGLVAKEVIRGTAIAVPATIIGLAAVGGIIAGLHALARRRRRARAVSPEDLVAVSGQEVTELVAALGAVRRPFDTDIEWAQHLVEVAAEPATVRLGQLLTRAKFDPTGLTEAEADEASQVAELLGAAVRARTSRWQRMLVAMDPRSVERRARARARAEGSHAVGSRIRISVADADR